MISSWKHVPFTLILQTEQKALTFLFKVHFLG